MDIQNKYSQSDRSLKDEKESQHTKLIYAIFLFDGN